MPILVQLTQNNLFRTVGGQWHHQVAVLREMSGFMGIDSSFASRGGCFWRTGAGYL